MEVICVTTSKGGAAKTTNTVEIAAALKVLGKKVLVIDVDQTTGLTKYVGAYYEPEQREEYGIKTIYDVMTGNSSVDEAINNIEYFDLIVSDERLSMPEKTFNQPDDQYILKDITDMLKELDYDYVLIDHGPQKDLLQKMAYIASDKLFITTMLSDGDRAQAKNAVDEIIALQNTRHKLVSGQIKGFIVSRTKRASLADLAVEDMQELAEYCSHEQNTEVQLFKVPDAIALGEAQTYKIPNSVAHKGSAVSRVYYDIAEYIIGIDE